MKLFTLTLISLSFLRVVFSRGLNNKKRRTGENLFSICRENAEVIFVTELVKLHARNL